MTQNNLVVIVGCSQTKSDLAKCKAKDLYQGQLFKKSMQYAELLDADVLIASSKYGLVSPDATIENYDYTIIGKSSNEKGAFRHRCQSDWAAFLSERSAHLPLGAKMDEKKTYWPKQCVILTGKEYHRLILKTSIPRVCSIELPLEGLGIGQRLKWLNDNIEQLEAAQVPKVQGVFF